MKLSTVKKELFPHVASGDRAAMLRALTKLLNRRDCGPSWTKSFTKLYKWVESDYTQAAPFSIFAKGGNSKLPFLAFSAMPGADFCPGAGDCLKFCYSFRAHRYPAALCRQIQNTLLQESENGRHEIVRALSKIINAKRGKIPTAIRAGKKIDFRLFVDGDFRNAENLNFWFSVLASDTGQKMAVYGYSKSFHLFAAYTGQWPNNYLLNISSGSNASPQLIEKIESLPVTRGHFKAVPMGKKINSKMHGNRAHQKELRNQYRAETGRKAFTCPGKCGDCTNAGHACGSEAFRGIDIVIAVH